MKTRSFRFVTGAAIVVMAATALVSCDNGTTDGGSGDSASTAARTAPGTPTR